MPNPTGRASNLMVSFTLMLSCYERSADPSRSAGLSAKWRNLVVLCGKPRGKFAAAIVKMYSNMISNRAF